MDIRSLMGITEKFDFSGTKTYDGSKVPRVTSILSFIDGEGLIDWANAMGRRGVDNKKILEAAARTGTITHESIERFLRDDIQPEQPGKAYLSFLKWYEKVKETNTIEILGQEERLSCDWFTGTYDCLLKINNRTFLMDFKTSNHVQYKYCMQLAAYRYMLRETKGIELDGCLVLQLNKNKVMYNEFVLDFSNPDDLAYINMCEESFLMLAMTYHKIAFVKSNYPW